MAQARRRRPIAIAAVAAISGLVLLAGCSSGGTTSSEESGQAETTAASAAAEAPTGVTLTLWHNSADSQALLDMYKRYEQESGGGSTGYPRVSRSGKFRGQSEPG